MYNRPFTDYAGRQGYQTAAQHDLPPIQPLQYPRSIGLSRQHTLDSPHQQPHSGDPTPHGSYISPQSSTPAGSSQPYQSPYVGTNSGLSQHHRGEAAYYGAHPSPYSANSTTASYATPETSDSMATQVAVSRPQYPTIYHTPQSNSPASIHSPQTDAHGRPLYGMAQPTHHIYYPPSFQMQHQSYTQHPGSAQHSPMTSAPSSLLQYHHGNQQVQHQSQNLQQQQQQHRHVHSPQEQEQKPAPLQRPSSDIAQSQTPMVAVPQPLPRSSTGASGNAAPGPIPATTPLVVKQDNSGVQWITFEYSRDRVKMQYVIRCDVESVNTNELSQEFRSSNCVYPRACCTKDIYKGNRYNYESECNEVGWALSQLNPTLREKRGLIQRAVDSWRNSNQDPKLRSRRVRRQHKVQGRKSATQSGLGLAGQHGLPQGPSNAAMHVSQAQQGPSSLQGMPSGYLPAQSPMYPAQMQHYHGPGTNNHNLGSNAEHGYETASNHYTPASIESEYHPSHPSAVPRYAQNFHPTYALPPLLGTGAPPLHQDSVSAMHSHRAALNASHVKHERPANEEEEQEHSSRKRKLFGSVPEAKRRKFIIIDDSQRDTRVRVRVTFDQESLDEMPDAHLELNSVYPRSYYARQTGSPACLSRAHSMWDDVDDDDDVPTARVSSSKPALQPNSKTLVPIPSLDLSEPRSMPIPRTTKSRRNREIALNELGYIMSWAQPRQFNGRTLFLQRALDAYRNKTRAAMESEGEDVLAIAPHLITRPGKRKWNDGRRKRVCGARGREERGRGRGRGGEEGGSSALL